MEEKKRSGIYYQILLVISGILLSNKKSYLAIFKNMGGSGGYAWWSKSYKERQILYVFTYIWNFKDKTNKNIAKQKQTYRSENKLVNLGSVNEGGDEIGGGD